MVDSDDDGFGPARSVVSIGDSVGTDRQVEVSHSLPDTFNSNIDAAVRNAQTYHCKRTFSFSSCAESSTIQFPWGGSSGSGVWSERLKQQLTMVQPLIPVLFDPPVPAQTSLRLASGKCFPAIVRRLPFLSWPQQQSAKRHLVLQK